MGYRGRKFIEQIRSLEKRNLIQEESYSGKGRKIPQLVSGLYVYSAADCCTV